MGANILSLDYEDWFTTSHYKAVVTSTNKKYIIEEPTLKLLDLLDRNETKATFFVLGQVAKDCPKLIRQICQRGHEIASHGLSHSSLHDLTPSQFEYEIKESTKILEDQSQKKVIGFRAPFFSLTQGTSWALQILKQEGYLYDSSIFPMKTTRYGVANAPLQPYYIQSQDITKAFSSGNLIELPISIYKSKAGSIPCSGGIYGRIIPYNLLSHLLDSIHANGNIVFYLHPWELMNKKGLVPYPGLIKNFLANYQSENYLNKLERLVRRFDFTTAENFIKDFSVSQKTSI